VPYFSDPACPSLQYPLTSGRSSIFPRFLKKMCNSAPRPANKQSEAATDPFVRRRSCTGPVCPAQALASLKPPACGQYVGPQAGGSFFVTQRFCHLAKTIVDPGAPDFVTFRP